MKKILLILLSLFFMTDFTRATVHIVQVANFQFTPFDIPNVVVGDVIRWVWVDGSHTTTCDPFNFPGSQAPAGAANWNSDISQSSPQFDYTVTVAGSYVYFCAPHFPNMGGTFTATNSTVPVKLSSFLVQEERNQPALVWKTQSEVNTSHFIVRRSLNGKDYEEIATVKAGGNSTTEKSYAYTDLKTSKNNKYYYYNLAMVDRDGKTTYSEVGIYKNSLAPDKLIIGLSPNPITKEGHLNLSFNADKEGNMSVKVLSPDGKVIITRTMQAYTGVNRGHVHLGERPAGTYTLICTLDEITETQRIVVQ